MSRLWIFFAALLSLSIGQAEAQSSSATQELTFQVSSTQPWTDTGLVLQSGERVKISAAPSATSPNNPDGSACNPMGVSAVGRQSNLPVANANPGALIAKLHAHGAAPLLIGTGRDLQIEETSHLFLGMNYSATPACQGTLTVTVQKIPASSTGSSTENQPTRGEQLKSQLSNAAQIFMSGQFGLGKSEASAPSAASGNSAGPSAATPLHISSAPLDPDLRAHIDNLPRRVNDQLNNLGDMVNFVIIGSQKDLQSALEAATWHIADTDNRKAVVNAIMDTYDNKDYLAMPMSTLYLFGRKQDFGYEMAEPIAMVASRHHFRIWKAPFNWNGAEVWVGAGTHDIGFAKDKRNNNVTHKIDPAVDGERDNIASSLQRAGKTELLTYYLPPNPVQDAKNATGDVYRSDGRIVVIFLQ